MDKLHRFLCVLAALVIVLFVGYDVHATVNITVDPEITRSIQGISELDRTVYFSMCDSGSRFDKRCKDEEMYDYLINETGSC